MRSSAVRFGWIYFAFSFLALCAVTPARAGAIVYVDATAAGANNGTSWSDAFRELSDALTYAALPANNVNEVWVARGSYTPSPVLRDRSVSFRLITGVAIYGGFAGGEMMLSQRDPAANPTILNGDLNGDDAAGGGSSNCCVPHVGPGCDVADCQAAVCAVDSFCCESTWDMRCAEQTACLCGNLCSTRCDNSYHVVTANGTSLTARLDGFIIRGGNAKGPAPADKNGGGFYAVLGSATLVGCTLQDNLAETFGGGAHVVSMGQPVRFVRCDFINNRANFGGGARVEGGSTYFANVRFLGNTAAAEGGGLRLINGSATLVNALFSGNVAAGSGGGGLSASGASPTIINAVFSGNRALPSGLGGGLNLSTSTNVIANTILWGNQDAFGTGEGGQIRRTGGSLSLQYSTVQGLTGALGGAGNIGTDPQFVDANGPDNVFGTIDDNHRLSETSPCIDAGSNPALPLDVLDLDQDGVFDEPLPVDLSGRPRRIDDPFTPNTGLGAPPLVDMGVFERKSDCNDNGVRDTDDILNMTSQDCNGNLVPDECEISLTSTAPGGPFYCIPPCDPDCNNNGRPDACDISMMMSGDFNHNGTPDECEPDCNGNGFPDFIDLLFMGSQDCDHNGIPDECEADCNGNGVTDRCDIMNCTGSPACGDCNNNGLPDACDIAAGAPDCDADGIPDGCEADCNASGVPDQCEITSGTVPDCNGNGVPDSCDIVQGVSADCDNNAVPDECEEDCNDNGLNDACDIALGISMDCNGNGSPDECDLSAGVSLDCNHNGRPDECDIAGGVVQDCQPNGVPDPCDIAAGTSTDADANGIPDECKPDCNLNGIADAVDILQGTSNDCDNNNVPDECQADCNENGEADSCDIGGGTSLDCNHNAVPDECESDCNGNHIPDQCDLANGAPDLNNNGLLDVCEPDCNGNGFPDFLDLFFNVSRDCNDNDVPDECDIAGNVSQDVNGNNRPDECEPFGDGDSDGDIDLRDAARFQNCFTGQSAAGLAGGCAFFDADDDGDVDLLDAAEFAGLIAGP